MDKHESNRQVEMQHAFQHNVYLKKMSFPKNGCIYKGHHHEYDHVTLVAAGRVRVKFGAVPEAGLPDEEKEYEGVSMFVTRSFREHEITALEDNTVVCCIHALRTIDGQIIDPPSELTDQQFTSFQEVSRALKDMEMGPMAFDATQEKKRQLLQRADKEGTLEEGSGDQLL